MFKINYVAFFARRVALRWLGSSSTISFYTKFITAISCIRRLKYLSFFLFLQHLVCSNIACGIINNNLNCIFFYTAWTILISILQIVSIFCYNWRSFDAMPLELLSHKPIHFRNLPFDSFVLVVHDCMTPNFRSWFTKLI